MCTERIDPELLTFVEDVLLSSLQRTCSGVRARLWLTAGAASTAALAAMCPLRQPVTAPNHERRLALPQVNVPPHQHRGVHTCGLAAEAAAHCTAAVPLTCGDARPGSAAAGGEGHSMWWCASTSLRR